MSYSYRFHPLAYKDYYEAYEWYEDKSEGLGEKFITAVRNRIEEIGLHPENYGSKGRISYREAIVKGFPYIIAFKIYKKNKEIFISSVHHAKRHPKNKYR